MYYDVIIRCVGAVLNCRMVLKGLLFESTLGGSEKPQILHKINLGTIAPIPPVSGVKLCRRTRVNFVSQGNSQ